MVKRFSCRVRGALILRKGPVWNLEALFIHPAVNDGKKISADEFELREYLVCNSAQETLSEPKILVRISPHGRPKQRYMACKETIQYPVYSEMGTLSVRYWGGPCP